MFSALVVRYRYSAACFLRIEKDEAGLASKQREGSKFLDKEREGGEGGENMMNLSELRIYVYYD